MVQIIEKRAPIKSQNKRKKYQKEAFGKIPNLIISDNGKVIDKFNIEAAKIQEMR